MTSQNDWHTVVTAAKEATATIPRLKASADAIAAITVCTESRDLDALKRAIKKADAIDRGDGSDVDWSTLDVVLADAKKRANIRQGGGSSSVSRQRGTTPSRSRTATPRTNSRMRARSAGGGATSESAVPVCPSYPRLDWGLMAADI